MQEVSCSLSLIMYVLHLLPPLSSHHYPSSSASSSPSPSSYHSLLPIKLTQVIISTVMMSNGPPTEKVKYSDDALLKYLEEINIHIQQASECATTLLQGSAGFNTSTPLSSTLPGIFLYFALVFPPLSFASYSFIILSLLSSYLLLSSCPSPFFLYSF